LWENSRHELKAKPYLMPEHWPVIHGPLFARVTVVVLLLYRKMLGDLEHAGVISVNIF
jgi:hypothetical protein